MVEVRREEPTPGPSLQGGEKAHRGRQRPNDAQEAEPRVHPSLQGGAGVGLPSHPPRLRIPDVLVHLKLHPHSVQARFEQPADQFDRPHACRTTQLTRQANRSSSRCSRIAAASSPSRAAS